MSQLITDLNEVEKAIKCILESKSLINIDEDDFGDYDKIIGYQSFELIDESSEFNYSIDQDIADKTIKLIVNIACDNALTLAFLDRILSKIRTFFNPEIEMIYGHSDGVINQHIVIDIFLLKSRIYINVN